MKKITFIKKVFALSCVTFLSSCSMMYMPNTINTPLFGEKGDLEVAAYTALNGYDVQAAYAPTDHIGVMLNTNFLDNSTDSTMNFHRHFFIEGGVGYYTKIGEKGRAEVYGGYGMGTLNSVWDSGSLFANNAQVSNNRIFIQPAIGLSNDIIDFSFSPRFAYVNATQGNIKASELFIEPTVTLKAGYKYVKAVTQMGLSFPLDKTAGFLYQPFLLSFGLQVNVGEFFK